MTFTATVTGGDVAAGTVQFLLDGTSVIAVPVAGVPGDVTASFTTSSLTAGSHSIEADFGGDGINLPSGSSLIQTVNQAASSTSLVSAPNPSAPGQSVIFTATVTGASPTGTVQFKDGASNLGSPVTLAGGVASFPTSSLTSGSHSITAVYSGDGNNTASTSAALTQNVTGVAPTITSANSTTFRVGVAGTFTVTTTGSPHPALSEAGALPAGVTFVDNGNGTATLSGTPAAGTSGAFPFTITASNGTTALQTFTLTVTGVAPTITSASNTTFRVGVGGTFTVTTTGTPTPTLSEAGALPAGVTFVDNGNGTATLSGTPAAGTSGAFRLRSQPATGQPRFRRSR